jgi:uncharacterized damage-inducible protein DinB
MSEIMRIHDQLHRSYYGEAWHGPSLRESLSGITAEQAGKHGIAGAHTIWEIVLHIAAWETIAHKVLAGRFLYPRDPLPQAQDWPPVGQMTEQGWAAALARLDDAHRGLEEALRNFPDARLFEKVPGERPYTFYFLLHGVVQHNTYHAGQIALLKKL